MRRLFAASLFAAATLAGPQAHAADQVRSVAPFTSVANSGPFSLRIEVGKTQSVTVSGSPEFLQALRTEVAGGQLQLSMREHGVGKRWGDPQVTITVPQLSAFAMSGAGETTLTHLAGGRLDIEFSGAGSIKADGSLDKLHLEVSGVGSIDTRELHADSADVDVSGVGSVKVYAASRLDANVSGVGSVTYYGNPKVANTHSSGIGSISRGR
jgi:hypothetical protein